MAALYLFDIDGTIVDMTPVHVAAYRAAYTKVLGLDVAEDVLVKQFGQVERKIHEAVFRHYGIKEKAKIKPIISLHVAGVMKAFKTDKMKVLPGVREFLIYLRKREQPIGVVTGNSRKIGEAILKKAGLYGYFDVYSYGNASKRAHIVRNAIRAARKQGIKFRKVIVIGDSPFDMHAAKANNAISVAVATGRYSLNELKKEKPDFAVKSFKAYRTGIMIRQLEGRALTQSERNRLSRDIKPKLEFIRNASRFEGGFKLGKNQENKEIIKRAAEVILQDELGSEAKAILLFGSFADGTFTPRSDIDICVVFRKDISLKEATQFRIRASGQLPDKADMQVFNVLPQKIKREVARNHKVLYKANDYDNMNFSTRHLKNEKIL